MKHSHLIRSSIGIGVLAHVVSWYNLLDFLFKDSGAVNKQIILSRAAAHTWSILFFTPDTWVFPLYLILITSLILLITNRLPRITAAITYALLISFVNRLPSIYYGGYQFLIFALFFLIFLDEDDNEYTESTTLQTIHWARLAIQLEVCFIYFFSALMKLREPMWLSGTQMFEVLNIYGAYWDFTWLKDHPFIVALLTYGPMFLELSAPFLIWFSQTRTIIITALILMHVGIMLTMNVTFLSETMICLLMAFIVPRRDLPTLQRIFTHRRM